MRSFKRFLLESVLPGKDISDWKAEGDRLGTNEGAVHHASDGAKHYVKFMTPAQTHEEAASAEIYEKIGAHTDNPVVISKGHKTGLAKPWIHGMRPYDHSPTVDDNTGHQLAAHFHAAVLTRNWDALGVDGTNLQHHGDKLVTIDHGGSFSHRAQGAPKPGGYTPDIGEHKTLRDPHMNPMSASAFSGMKPHHVEASLQKLRSTPVESFHGIFQKHGLEHHWPSFKSRYAKLTA